MKKANKAWCRIYQAVFRIAMPLLPYYEPEILHTTNDVPNVLASRHIDSVLLVTDPGIAGLGLTRGLEEALSHAGINCAIYANTQANPTVSNVEEAAALYREHSCCAIIGFGGGSAMDCAKGVGARIAQPCKPINRMRGLLRVHRRLPLLIAVPTTAGTGSEVTLAAVITDDKTHYKYPVNDFVLIPRYAVHDPRLTCGLPASITGQTGMDALTHAVEAYIGRSTNAYTRAAAKRAVRLIHD
ncbi:MAG: iron-containing alcohol dehydrogenase, partial [Collinsella bouchesdurhonensis]|nr:iron-containing alcohol dehydrogenase [Collinsella bouchesdurhonensis]